MNDTEFIKQWLPVVMRFDIRLLMCTFTKVGKTWKHLDKKCAKCCAEYILKLSTPQGVADKK